jgi:hypothetical protein
MRVLGVVRGGAVATRLMCGVGDGMLCVGVRASCGVLCVNGVMCMRVIWCVCGGVFTVMYYAL